MIQVVFNSAPAFLLDDVPDWNLKPQLDAELPGGMPRGLTGREERRPFGDTLRLSLRYSATIKGSARVTALRNSLQALNKQPVLCPLWMCGFDAGDAPLVESDFYVLMGDGD